jgi:endo-1,4-beta-mannosidase
MGKIETLLATAWQHGIRLIPCFEFGQDLLAAPDAANRWKKAVTAVVNAHRDDGRVLMWDLMNEPDDDAKWTDATRAYLRGVLPFVKQLDTNHLVTVGIAFRIDRLAETGLPDVLQYHEYCTKQNLFERGEVRVVESFRGQRRTGGEKPLLIGEFGMSTARDPQYGAEESLRGKINEAPGTEAEQARLYGIVLAAAEKEHIAGVLPWCLHDYPIKNPNEAHFGLVRSDGTLKPAALLLRDAYTRWSKK